jgi:hypothetical protein
MEKKYIYDLHADHKEWINKIAFYKDEVKVMRNRLAEVAGKYTDHDVQAMVEHFQNQLIVQDEQADIMRHNVKQYEHVIEDHLKKNDVAADHTKWDDHVILRDQVETFEKLFNELRKDLITFLARWM